MHEKNAACLWKVKLPFAGYSVGSLKLSGTTHLRAVGATVDESREGLPTIARDRERRRDPRQTSMPVVIGSGSHPFPFRTRKLSLIPPMVLHGKLCGRVGRCRQSTQEGPMRCRIGPFCLPDPSTTSGPRLRQRSRPNGRFSGCRRPVPARSDSKEAPLTLAAERPRDTQASVRWPSTPRRLDSAASSREESRWARRRRHV